MLQDAAAWLFPQTQASKAAAQLAPQPKSKQLTQCFNHLFRRNKPRKAITAPPPSVSPAGPVAAAAADDDHSNLRNGEPAQAPTAAQQSDSSVADQLSTSSSKPFESVIVPSQSTPATTSDDQVSTAGTSIAESHVQLVSDPTGSHSLYNHIADTNSQQQQLQSSGQRQQQNTALESADLGHKADGYQQTTQGADSRQGPSRSLGSQGKDLVAVIV